jgi:NADH pyrophosphatase NudC (nudix superfamily)
MILLKSCPRCHGDMMQEELQREVEMVCLQCGHRAYPELQARQPAVQSRIARKAA